MSQKKKYVCTSYTRWRKDMSKIISFHFSNLRQKGKKKNKRNFFLKSLFLLKHHWSFLLFFSKRINKEKWWYSLWERRNTSLMCNFHLPHYTFKQHMLWTTCEDHVYYTIEEFNMQNESYNSVQAFIRKAAVWEINIIYLFVP